MLHHSDFMSQKLAPTTQRLQDSNAFEMLWYYGKVIHTTSVLVSTCQYVTSTNVHGTFLFNPFHTHDLRPPKTQIPTFWSSAPLATFLVANFCRLLNANKCNYVGHWHTVKVLHKEGKGGQVSIQPFTAESNSLCHIHLHLHTYQVGRNLKLTNISIKFVPVMAQISFHAWASKNTIIKSVSWENFYSIWQIMFFS